MKRIFICMLSLSLLSCGDKGENETGGANIPKGKYTLSIETKAPTTKSVNNPTADFEVRVETPTGVVINEWERFDNIPAEMDILPGNYIAYASKGDSLAQGFDVPSLSGLETFKVEQNKITAVKITCKHNKSLVSVKTDEALLGFYSDIFTNVKNATSTLKYTKEEARIGYFKAGDINLTVNLTRKDGTKREITMPTIAAKANEHHTITITPASSEGSFVVNITIEKENQIIENVEIPFKDVN